MARRPSSPTVEELLGSERLTRALPSVHGERLAAVIAAPAPYAVAMGGLSLQAVWESLLDTGEFVCDRAFSGYPDGGALLPRLNLPDYDLVGLSLPYELDWLPIPSMLEAGGLPVWAAERSADAPVVVAGGASVTMNPEPLAEVVDAFVIGEAEPAIQGLTQALLSHEGRSARLAALAELPGVYVPTHARELPVQRLVWDGVMEHPRSSLAISPRAAFPGRFLIEIGRGCPMGCRFCLAGAVYRPVRYASAESVLRAASQGLRQTPRLGLIGAALSGLPELPELVGELVARGADVSLSSMRADRMSPELLRALAAGGQQSVTMAPEAGTERLRREVGKGIPDAAFERALEACAEAGVSEVKLYYMTGLPGETQEDRGAIVETVADWAVRHNGLRFAVTLSPFVPKPWTPFEGAAFPGAKESEGMLDAIGSELRRRTKVGVRPASGRWAAVQAALARGDREVGRALRRAAQKGGTYGALKGALKAEGIDLNGALAAPVEQPWRRALGAAEVCTDVPSEQYGDRP